MPPVSLVLLLSAVAVEEDFLQRMVLVDEQTHLVKNIR